MGLVGLGVWRLGDLVGACLVFDVHDVRFRLPANLEPPTPAKAVYRGVVNSSPTP